MFTKTLQTNQSKFKAIRQTYEGNSYHSKKEAQYAAELDMLMRGKAIKSWQRQVKIELLGENGTKVCNYFIDFVVTHKDGTTEYVEVKGFETPEWKLKWKLFEDKMKGQHDVKLTVLK